MITWFAFQNFFLKRHFKHIRQFLNQIRMVTVGTLKGMKLLRLLVHK